MNAGLQNRWIMTALGLVAGLALYGLGELITQEVLGTRAGLGLIVVTLAFFTALLAMAGPVGLRRALAPAGLIAAVAGGLLLLGSTRFTSVSSFLDTGLPVVAVFVLTLIPIPFVIARCGGDWRDYPTLFTESWDLVVRYAAALIFVGIVWAVVLLSDTLLKLVGLSVIADLLRVEAMPFALTGAALGLAMAVVTELEEMISPDLFLRLLRLLLPVVLAVMAVFLLALPLRGLSGLFGNLSAAATLMVMLGLAATLVTTALAQTDAEAAESPVLRLSARGMALIMPVFAGLAVWAVALRVAQYGWTPDRVIAAVLAALGLGYGVIYGLSAGLGGPWMARIRRGNIRMALAALLACALLLTPVLNPQAIATRSQMARLDAGTVAPAEFDAYALQRWGVAGQAAFAALSARSAEPGNEALATALAATPGAITPEGQRERLLAALQILPPDRGAEAAALLRTLPDWELSVHAGNCARKDTQGQPSCLLVFADFWPQTPGDEAILLARGGEARAVQLLGFAPDGAAWRRVSVHQARAPGTGAEGAAPDYLTGDEAEAILDALRAAVPATEPAPLNRMRLGDLDLFLLP